MSFYYSSPNCFLNVMVTTVTALRVPFMSSRSILFWANTLQVGFHSQSQAYANVYLSSLTRMAVVFPPDHFERSWLLSIIQASLINHGLKLIWYFWTRFFFFRGHLMGLVEEELLRKGEVWSSHPTLCLGTLSTSHLSSCISSS